MLGMKKALKKAMSMVLVFTMIFSSAFMLYGCGQEEEAEAKVKPSVEKNNEKEEIVAEEEKEFDGTIVTDMANVYECELVMGEGMTMMLYLRVDEEGNFVFSRSTDFSSTDKGAGKVYKTDDGEYCFVYYIVNGENVEVGEYVSTFELGENNSILFTSTMWFGATKPSTGEGSSVAYPEFVVSEEEVVNDIDKDAITNKDIATNVSSSSDKKQNTVTGSESSNVSLKMGTYGGKYTTTAMGSELVYSYSMTFNSNNTYNYDVSFSMRGSNYQETESGTYKVNGSIITLTNSDGETMTGTINSDGTVTLTRYISSFAFSEVTITLTYGYSTGDSGIGSGSGSGSEEGNAADGNEGGNETPGDGNGGSEGGDEEPDKEEPREEEPGEENPDEDEPEVDVVELEDGEYAVDISWSPMANYFAPVLSIDEETMTFTIYGASDPSTIKGSGTISYEEGVYTLTYEVGEGEEEKTTTFTYEEGVITFTSALYYGAASFNNVDEEGNFVSYTATLMVEDVATIESGEYSVDISWSPMANYFAPVLSIDAETMTFNVYGASDPSTIKGSGTISYEEGVYTLTYEVGEGEEEKTTTFTYEEGVITFTSPLYYGAASFNNVDEEGNFVSYTATLISKEDEE